MMKLSGSSLCIRDERLVGEGETLGSIDTA